MDNNGNRYGGWGNSRTQQIKKFNKGFINYSKTDSVIKYIRTTDKNGNRKYLTKDDVYNFTGNVEIAFDFQGVTILMIGVFENGKFFPMTTNNTQNTQNTQNTSSTQHPP